MKEQTRRILTSQKQTAGRFILLGRQESTELIDKDLNPSTSTIPETSHLTTLYLSFLILGQGLFSEKQWYV